MPPHKGRICVREEGGGGGTDGKNREKAGLRNLTVVEGDALEQIKRIADRRNKGESGTGRRPKERLWVTHAFIGGTSGNLEAVVELLLSPQWTDEDCYHCDRPGISGFGDCHA